MTSATSTQSTRPIADGQVPLRAAILGLAIPVMDVPI